MTEETVLLRQAHPRFMDGDAPTSQAFVPFPKDEGNLSVYDGDQGTAAESYSHYTEVQKLESAGVWGVTKAETDELDLPAAPDPLPGNPAHAVIQFGERTQRESRKLAKALKRMALERGCLHRPDPKEG